MSVKICSDSIGKLSRNLSACSAVHQPNALSRETEGHVINGYKLHAHNFSNSFVYLRSEKVTLKYLSRILIYRPYQ